MISSRPLAVNLCFVSVSFSPGTDARLRAPANGMIRAIRIWDAPVPEASKQIMHRWTARFALLVMLVPVFGPLALANVVSPSMKCCMRRPVTGATAGTANPAMHCHHGAMEAQAADTQGADSREHSLRSQDCCGQHCCCQNSQTPEWARPASNSLTFTDLPTAPPVGASTMARVSSPLMSADLARAPPRS